MKKTIPSGKFWFFAWTSGKPYITTICGATREAVQEWVASNSATPWETIYRQGGRVVRCYVIAADKKGALDYLHILRRGHIRQFEQARDVLAMGNL